MPWDKKPVTSAASAVYATIGAVVCYKLKCNDDTDQWEFKHWWCKGYSV